MDLSLIPPNSCGTTLTIQKNIIPILSQISCIKCLGYEYLLLLCCLFLLFIYLFTASKIFVYFCMLFKLFSDLPAWCLSQLRHLIYWESKCFPVNVPRSYHYDSLGFKNCRLYGNCSTYKNIN